MTLNMIWYMLQKAVKCYFVPLPRLSYIYTDLFTLRPRNVFIGYPVGYPEREREICYTSIRPRKIWENLASSSISEWNIFTFLNNDSQSHLVFVYVIDSE